MSNEIRRAEATIGERTITLETGRVARRASGAIWLRERGTVLLATVSAGDPQEDQGFFPLTVEYREKMAASGRIPGNFFRRETRMGEHEVLTSRLVDRALRPHFHGPPRPTLVAVTVYSAEPDSDLEGLAITAAGAAATLSDVPFSGPVAGVRVQDKQLDLVLAADADGLVAVEGQAQDQADDAVHAALERGFQAVQPVLAAIQTLAQGTARPEGVAPAINPDVGAALEHPTLVERKAALKALTVTDTEVEAVARARLLEGKRAGGRQLDAVRPISCEADLLPSNHGSALFTRGNTQALVSVTLGGNRDARDMERLDGMERRRFMVHYNFPSFAVGDVWPNRGPGRRETGHGTLARRALEPVIPNDYPFVVRVVSDITEADGSSSMATVCGASLALRAAGVPLTAPVAGVAMGLVAHEDHVRILTDIDALEDHAGQMDFKVAGTAQGVTAIQLDNKAGSVSLAHLRAALTQARAALDHILAQMAPALAALDRPAPDHVPRLERLRVHPSKVGQVIGSGGRTLTKIQQSTKAKIEVANDGSGRVTIMGSDAESTRAAVRAIQAISLELEKGALYLGQVTNVVDFGAFVKFADHEALVHTSELSGPVESGQELLVRLLGTDDRGRLKLSQKAAADADRAQAINV